MHVVMYLAEEYSWEVRKFVKDLPEYKLSFFQMSYCMIYGAVVSATDPVAVVALLKALGVPHHLKVLIEGESLFNDGAAIFFHSLIHTVLTHTTHVASKDAVLYIQIIYRLVGVSMSVVVGLIFARITAVMLGNLYDSVRERAVVLIGVYSCYVTAETIQGSGVLCLVVYGIALNSRRQWMSTEAYTDNKRMWGFLAYFANCIIFIITGMLAARDMYGESGVHIALGKLKSIISFVSLLTPAFV